MNKKKTIILTSIIVGVLVVTLGLTYAVLSFNQTGGNSQLVLGDIYMHYNETKALTIENAMPGSPYSNYFEFTISGKNTYTKNDIYYDFILTRGDLLEGKTEDNRIPDKYLKFKLVSVVEDVEIVLLEDKKYNDLVNKRIYVETIGKNTTTEVNRTYRLYMTIDNSLEIGNSETAVFGIEEWKEAFASIKVNVTGDFNEKELLEEATDASCFETESITKYSVNPNMTEEMLNTCAGILGWSGFALTDPEESLESFCQGTTTATFYGYTFQQLLDHNYFSEYELNRLEENNIIINNGFNAVKIINYDVSCGSDVVIPKTINDYSVTILGDDSFNSKNLTSVEIPNTVTTIEGMAFAHNNLTKLVIPDSVIVIGQLSFDGSSYRGGTFENNQLLTIEIGNGIELIGKSAFEKNLDSNPNLESIVIDRTCSDVKNIIGDYYEGTAAVELHRDYFYPWLSSSTPYSAEGVTITGSDGVCDTF